MSGSSFAPRNVLVLARMDPDGTLDPSFGVSGIVAHTVGDGSPIAVSLLVQRDGRYVVAGQTQSAAVGSQFGVLRFLAGTCGNRTVEPGETCDDGNTAGDDCCSEGCLLEPAGEPCAADVLRCTLDRCDGAGRCEHPADLRTDCRVSVAPGAGQLRLRNERRDGRDLLEWRWAKGEATSVAELGEPFEPTDYTLCGFDLSSDPAGTPLFEMSAPGGGTCGAGPCWALPSLARVRYRNQSRTPDGLAALVIGAGIEGRTRIVARGKGKLLGLPSLPLPLPVVVQLHAANGLCWEARYSSGGVGANARTHFSGRAD